MGSLYFQRCSQCICALLWCFTISWRRRTRLQTPICLVPKIGQENHTGYLSGVFCIVSSRTQERAPMEETAWQPAAPESLTAPAPSPHLPIRIAVTVSSSSFVISMWQKNLLVPGKLAKPQLSGSSSMLHKTTFFNTVQDCSLRNIMVSMDFSCQEEDPANTFCMYIYCNSEVEHIVKFLYFSTFPSRKYFFR